MRENSIQRKITTLDSLQKKAYFLTKIQFCRKHKIKWENRRKKVRKTMICSTIKKVNKMFVRIKRILEIFIVLANEHIADIRGTRHGQSCASPWPAAPLTMTTPLYRTRRHSI